MISKINQREKDKYSVSLFYMESENIKTANKFIPEFLFSLCFVSSTWAFLNIWATCQAPLSMEFSRQEYWDGCFNAITKCHIPGLHFPSLPFLPSTPTIYLFQKYWWIKYSILTHKYGI